MRAAVSLRGRGPRLADDARKTRAEAGVAGHEDVRWGKGMRDAVHKAGMRY